MALQIGIAQCSGLPESQDLPPVPCLLFGGMAAGRGELSRQQIPIGSFMGQKL